MTPIAHSLAFAASAMGLALGAGCRVAGPPDDGIRAASHLTTNPESGVLGTDEPLATVLPIPGSEDRAAAAGWHAGNWMTQHEDINRIGEDRPIDIVLLGDSITQGWGGEGRRVGSPAQRVWRECFGDEDLKIANCGISGDRTQHVLWRLRHGNLDHVKPRFVVLLIGTNNIGHDPPEDIAAGVEAIVDQIRAKTPGATVLLCGIVRGGTADDPSRQDADRINALIRPLDDGERIRFIDLPTRFYAPDGAVRAGLMPDDFVHFTDDGYRVWARSLKPHFDTARRGRSEPGS